MAASKLHFDELTLEGSSLAGDETWFRVHPPGLALDVGRGAPELTGASDLFLTHGHLDHASGLPWVLSQRRLQGLAATRVHCPSAMAGPLADLIRAAERMEESKYDFELKPMCSGDRVRVGRDLEVEAFATDHVVPSLGYHLIRRKRRLRSKYQGEGPEELRRRRLAGEPIERVSREVWLSFAGDTGAAVFDLEPRLFESRLLLLECTFVGRDTREGAREFKHIHLDDLVSRSGSFHNGTIVLHHRSRRFRADEMEIEIARLQTSVAPRVELFPELS